MSLTRWLRTLRSALTPSRVYRKHRQQPALWATPYQLQVEVLDDRCLPSTFTVTNLQDNGPDSLRAAVIASNANPGPDTIDFVTTGTIALTSGQLDITDSLTINGPGQFALIVSGNQISRVFAQAGNPSVSIANLTIADGRTTGSPGSGISMAGGNLTLDHITVTGNTATGATGSEGKGGGIYVTGGTVTLNHVTVDGNNAIGGPGTGGFAVLYGGNGGDGAGGGIYLAGGVMHVNQSTISNNSAVGGQGGDSDEQYWTGWENTYGGNGGNAVGGGIRVEAGAVDFYQTTISGNTAAGGFGGTGTFNGWSGMSVGGGLSIEPASQPLPNLDTFTESNTINNFADSDPNISGPYSLNESSSPSLSIDDRSIVEGNGVLTAFVFTVTLSAPSVAAVSVSYAAANGTATTGSDYQTNSGTLTFAPGETSKTITIQVKGDRLPEANETFFVNLTNPTNATIVDSQGFGTILDDEPRISISDMSKKEGKKGQTTLFTFTVTLSTAYDQSVTMSFRTADGTAKISDNDYLSKTGTLTFQPGETSKTITIEVKGDSKKEGNESFYVDLFGNSSNSLISKSRAIGTILNDDSTSALLSRSTLIQVGGNEKNKIVKELIYLDLYGTELDSPFAKKRGLFTIPTTNGPSLPTASA